MEEIKNYVQIEKRDIFKLGIKDENGNVKLDENGNEIFIEFDFEDIELPLKYNKCDFLVKKAYQDLKFDFLIIDKRQDVKGKMILTKNQEDKIKAQNKYYHAMEDAMNLFLGENGVQKIFGDIRYLTMYDDLNTALTPILPKLKINLEKIDDKIKGKYSNTEKDVLEDE